MAGVCGGIAEYFNVDPAIVRIVFAALVFLWGWGLILYIICWFAIPNRSELPPN
ncbi:MAG: PspC domain-containing protein [Elusimicrobia bacterium]|nr:PspC domain-containing protein [Elusimicrobiota bacterium]